MLVTEQWVGYSHPSPLPASFPCHSATLGPLLPKCYTQILQGVLTSQLHAGQSPGQTPKGPAQWLHKPSQITKPKSPLIWELQCPSHRLSLIETNQSTLGPFSLRSTWRDLLPPSVPSI